MRHKICRRHADLYFLDETVWILIFYLLERLRFVKKDTVVDAGTVILQCLCCLPSASVMGQGQRVKRVMQLDLTQGMVCYGITRDFGHLDSG